MYTTPIHYKRARRTLKGGNEKAEGKRTIPPKEAQREKLKTGTEKTYETTIGKEIIVLKLK